MKINYKISRSELFGDFCWLPSATYNVAPFQSVTMRAIEVIWLKWGFEFRWSVQ